MDITMTAVRRPEILDVTLSSFRDNLFGGSFAGHRLIINVDPVGGAIQDTIEIIKLCVHYFGANFLAHFPYFPNFADAFRWVWGQSTSDFVLHLEDDWLLSRKIDLKAIISILENESDLALIRLPAFFAGYYEMKNWNQFFPWTGKYYECPEDKRLPVGFCGHPSIIRQSFIQATAPYINPMVNPEKQFHHGPQKIMEAVQAHRFAVWGPQNMPPAVIDLGRKWLLTKPWRKSGNKAHFLNWEFVECQN